MEASDQITEAPAQTTEDLLRAVLAEQQQHRQEVASLREELAAAATKSTVVAVPATLPLSPEDALLARMNEVSKHDYYCPGCGRLVDYQQQCQGKAESPHPPIEVVSTDELKTGDQHTAAPATT
jgi:hypothetical protein